MDVMPAKVYSYSCDCLIHTHIHVSRSESRTQPTVELYLKGYSVSS